MAEQEYLRAYGWTVIMQVHNTFGYCDEYIVTKSDTLAQFFKWLDGVREYCLKWDTESLDLTEGEKFPWWSASYWTAIPYRIAMRYGKRANGEMFRQMAKMESATINPRGYRLPLQFIER